MVTLAFISVRPVLPNLLKNFSFAFHKYNSLYVKTFDIFNSN